ncbi:MAG: Arc family DNA-binding protein [Myxococcota bacterium]
MATLNIKNFPEPLARRLRTRARRSHRSVTQEVIQLLEQATQETEPLSILGLKGLGKEQWRDVDATKHVRAERDSWS